MFYRIHFVRVRWKEHYLLSECAYDCLKTLFTAERSVSVIRKPRLEQFLSIVPPYCAGSVVLPQRGAATVLIRLYLYPAIFS